MDRPLFAAARREGDTARRMGSGKLPIVVWRGESDHSRHVRSEAAILANVSPRVATLEGARTALERTASAPHRRVVDGDRRER